jgi:hypothetical protein
MKKMAKRFTDTEIWDKSWFMSLSPKMKCFVKYVRDKCDIAGLWHPNYTLASVYIGEQVDEDDLLLVDDGEQFEKLSDGKILCKGFIDFQYGGKLNPTSPIHAKVISILEKYNLPIEVKKVSQSFNAPSYTDVYNEMKEKLSDAQKCKIEAEKFINYYESNGWMIGRNKMKSWRASVSTWLNRIKPESKVRSESIKEKLNEIQNRKFTDI